jgi:hypothetical protein
LIPARVASVDVEQAASPLRTATTAAAFRMTCLALARHATSKMGDPKT